MAARVALDTSFVLGLLDAQDLWHQRSLETKTALAKRDFGPVVFDCVLAEVISTLARRTHEHRRISELSALLAQLRHDFPANTIVWLYPDLPQQYAAVVALVEQTQGELNFNDALIALACQTRNIKFLASFDKDFDQVQWLRRLSAPADVATTAEADDQ